MFRLCFVLVILVAHYELSSAEWEYEKIIHDMVNDPNMTQMIADHEREWAEMLKGMPTKLLTEFPCDTTPSTQKPTTVHELRPGDINVIAAMGDSISAGFGILATSVLEVVMQYRGYSWSVGGTKSYAEGVQSVANILKHYNRHITGFSTGNGRVGDERHSQMNVAVGGAKAPDLVSQAQMLVERLRYHEDVDFEYDWKLVTLFIGGNDLCAVCKNDENMHKFGPEMYRQNIEEALDVLMEIPRVFVNLASIFDITPLAEIERKPVCNILHKEICHCGVSVEDAHLVHEISLAYNEASEQIMNSDKYNSRPDFAVIYQPFLKDQDFPRRPDSHPDLSYMAPDCFHFSLKGHNSIATFLWNSMFVPVGSKSSSMPYDVALECPGPDQFLQTLKNAPKGQHVKRPWHKKDTVVISVVKEAQSHDDQGFMLRPLGILTAGLSVLILVVLVVLVAVLSRRTPAPQRMEPFERDIKKAFP